MILIGACRHPVRREGALVVVEATMSQGHKRYRICRRHSQRAGAGDPDTFCRSVRSCMVDRDLWRSKTLFSQDRRPKKTVPDPPRVVAFDDGSRVVEGLRDRGVVVEAVRFSPAAKWEKERVGKALGANYTVDPSDVMDCAGKVIAKGRIELPGHAADPLSIAPDSKPAAFFENVPATVWALALVLWFRETVPYRRSYRAN